MGTVFWFSLKNRAPKVSAGDPSLLRARNRNEILNVRELEGSCRPLITNDSRILVEFKGTDAIMPMDENISWLVLFPSADNAGEEAD